MSDNNDNNGKGGGSILGSVKGKRAQAKRKAAEGQLGGLLDDLEKADAVVAGVLEKITDLLVDAGESPEDIRKQLNR